MQELMDATKHLSKEEDKDLLSRLEKATCRDSLMLLLLRTYGMRSGELLAIDKTKDINHDQHLLYIRGTKGSNNREFPLTIKLYKRVMRAAKQSKSDKLFDIKYNRLGDIWRFWKMRDCDKSLHALRHTCAIDVYRKKKDIIIVKGVLGHRDIRTTMIYADYYQTSESFKELFL